MEIAWVEDVKCSEKIAGENSRKLGNAFVGQKKCIYLNMLMAKFSMPEQDHQK